MADLFSKRIKSLLNSYRTIKDFTVDYNYLSYIEFDYYTVNKVNLFTMNESFDFDFVDQTISEMLKALTPIKRIFSKPIIHLKDSADILPVESVHKINNETIVHAAVHSELWENINRDGNIKPRKLLTLNNQDDYQIYENKVFANTIDIMMMFIKENLHNYQEFMYNNRNLNFNLLERLDHIDYYLALGKLHTGYIRDLESYYGIIDSGINRMQYILNVLKSRLKRPVYKRNHKQVSSQRFELRKTNILKMHKDYHKVYLLANYFKKHNLFIDDSDIESELIEMRPYYFMFIKVLSIFALGHFNFILNENSIIDFDNINLLFYFKKWKLTIKEIVLNEINCLEISFFKDKEYKIILISETIKDNENEDLKMIKKMINADTYLIVSPFDEDKQNLYISITDIDSFRRLQQLFLQGMVYSDEVHDICPFCGNQMTLIDNHWECKSCKTIIGINDCSECEKQYYYTDIKNYKEYLTLNQLLKGKNWLVERKLESLMHFRNITPIDSQMNIVCPFCHKIHQAHK